LARVGTHTKFTGLRSYQLERRVENAYAFCEVKMKITSRVVLLVLLLPAICAAQSSLSTADARKHIGEKATVCGEVASTHYAERTKGSPTFINVDKPYPEQVFTILIWGSDRPKFGNPDRTYMGKRICVTGDIRDYKGVPEIIAYQPSQIKLQ